MRRIAAIALTALATTGCIGSSAGSGVAPSSDRNLAVPWSKTVVTIAYYARHCPPGASCITHFHANSSAQGVRVVRNLSCDPAHSADYDNPAAACRALTDIVTAMDANPTAPAVCDCPLSPGPPAKAVGFYQGGERRTIRLDVCSLCQLHVGADLAVLLPGSEG
jgi:hypothetical protein